MGTYILLQNINFNISLLQAIIGAGVFVIIAIILLWNNIPQRLASGWKDLSELQNKTAGALESDIIKLRKDAELREAAVTDLVRELDIRREINRQDTLTITSLKTEMAKMEEIISRLRKEVKDFMDETLENQSKKV